MPRLNVYIPDDLDLALRSHPREINVSRVCAAALRAELEARADAKPLPALFHPRNVSVPEEELMTRYHLPACMTASPLGEKHPRDVVTWLASEFLDRTLAEGMPLAVGGGTVMHGIARELRPRNVAVPVWALGFGHVDAEMPHLHANALATLLSLVFAPRAKAHLVGAKDFNKSWHYPSLFPPGEGIQRIIVGSCEMFDADSPYARVLGKELTDFLVAEHILGDFLGVFIAPDGRIVEPYTPAMTKSQISAVDLQRFSARDDTIVMLATSGVHKARLIRQVLDQKLCNMLVTDDDTAAALL